MPTYQSFLSIVRDCIIVQVRTASSWFCVSLSKRVGTFKWNEWVIIKSQLVQPFELLLFVSSSFILLFLLSVLPSAHPICFVLKAILNKTYHYAKKVEVSEFPKLHGFILFRTLQCSHFYFQTHHLHEHGWKVNRDWCCWRRRMFTPFIRSLLVWKVRYTLK